MSVNLEIQVTTVKSRSLKYLRTCRNIDDHLLVPMPVKNMSSGHRSFITCSISAYQQVSRNNRTSATCRATKFAKGETTR